MFPPASVTQELSATRLPFLARNIRTLSRLLERETILLSKFSFGNTLTKVNRFQTIQFALIANDTPFSKYVRVNTIYPLSRERLRKVFAINARKLENINYWNFLRFQGSMILRETYKKNFLRFEESNSSIRFVSPFDEQITDQLHRNANSPWL